MEKRDGTAAFSCTGEASWIAATIIAAADMVANHVAAGRLDGASSDSHPRKTCLAQFIAATFACC
jgi:hypothetical protein